MPSNGGLIYHLTLPWEDPKNHEFTSFKLQISVMVSIAVSKMGLTELIFVVPGMKVNGQHYPWCFTHFANAASNKACCKWYVCLSTRQRSISSLNVSSFWHNTGVWQTDRQTDGIAVASTALAMRALRRSVKNSTFLATLAAGEIQARSCTSKIVGGLAHSFATRGTENLGVARPRQLKTPITP